MEQKLNFNHNALTIEQLLQSRSNCSIVRAIGQFVHTAQCKEKMKMWRDATKKEEQCSLYEPS